MIIWNQSRLHWEDFPSGLDDVLSWLLLVLRRSLYLDFDWIHWIHWLNSLGIPWLGLDWTLTATCLTNHRARQHHWLNLRMTWIWGGGPPRLQNPIHGRVVVSQALVPLLTRPVRVVPVVQVVPVVAVVSRPRRRHLNKRTQVIMAVLTVTFAWMSRRMPWYHSADTFFGMF